MPARKNNVADVPATDEAVTETEQAIETAQVEAADTDVMDEADEPSMMRINLHVLIDVDPENWVVTANGDDASAKRDALVGILIAGGMDEAEAIATANKVHKPLSDATGPNAVRDAVKAYMLDSMRKLDAIVDAGAVVNYYERPVKN
jgi:hypothetical protein